MNARHTVADDGEQIESFLLGYMAMHAGKHVIADMLQGNIEILADVWLIAHHIEQIEWELIWVSIMQTNPLDTRNVGHIAD